MGDLFSGSTTTTSSGTSDTGPSSFQRPYLDNTFGAARDIYNNSAGTPYYQGATYAGMSPEQRATLDRMRSFAGGAGASGAQSITNVGNDLVSSTSGRAVSNLDRFTQMAGEDATAGNIQAATAYANNPAIDGQITAATRDVTRNLYENQLPGIDRAASGSGNINSSRAGVASGIAQRGAGDRIADVSASIRGDAYNQGLQLADSNRTRTLDAYRSAAGQFANLNGQGIDAIRAGTNMGYDALDAQGRAGSLDQANRQGQLDADFRRWQGNDTRATDLLSRYHGIIGSNAWGSSGTSSGTSRQRTSGNIFGQLAGLASTAASFIPT